MVARIREVATDEDLEAFVAIVNAVTPDSPSSVDDLRREDVVYPGCVRFLAEEDAKVVGTANIGRIYMLPPDYDGLWGSVLVLPEARRRGIGDALLRTIADVARGRGKSAIHGATSEARPEGIEFAIHRGFSERARHKMVRLDLEGLALPDEPVPDGIAITTLAERPELVAGVHAVALAAFPDIPGQEPPVPGDLAEFRARDVDWPRIPHDGFMVAVDEATGAVVGYSSLIFPAGSRAFATYDMTAVAPAWRGRGIASALKRATVSWAIANDLRYLETGNNEDNGPMRAVNAAFGFRPLPDELTMRGSVADIPPLDE